MPSDKARRKIANYRNYRGENAEKCVDYKENTLDHVEVVTGDKIDNNKVFQFTNDTEPKRTSKFYPKFKSKKNKIILKSLCPPILTYA